MDCTPRAFEVDAYFFQGTFGKHCVDLQAQLFLLKVLFFFKYKQIDTVFMRNAG
jgi:hypothetical protein